jgi:ABC-type transport system involved in cytochrome c biogenesis permease subunit
VRQFEKGSNTQLGPDWFAQPKVVLTLLAWVIYALVLHAPINPRFRGRRAAALSIAGFVLMVGILVVLQFTSGSATPAGPTGGGGVQ